MTQQGDVNHDTSFFLSILYHFVSYFNTTIKYHVYIDRVIYALEFYLI